MTSLQKLLYDQLRALGCRYVSTDRDGTVNLRNGADSLLLQPSGALFDLCAGKWRLVTFTR